MLRRRLWLSILHDLLSALGWTADATWDTDQSADASANAIDQSINVIWRAADEAFGLLSASDAEARASEFSSPYGQTLSPQFAGHVLAIMREASVDVETKMLCHGLMHIYCWNLAEHYSCSAERSDIDLHQLHELCVKNLASRNWGIFRGALQVLRELGHLIKLDIPEAAMSKLLSSLNSPSSPLTHSSALSRVFSNDVRASEEGRSEGGTGAKVLNWRTTFAFDALNVVQSYCSWETLLQADYLKTIIRVKARPDMDYRARLVAWSVWDAWPTEDIRFQKVLRDAVHALIHSENVFERYLFSEMTPFFLVHGICLAALDGVQTVQHDDKGAILCCRCLSKLLVDVICSCLPTGFHFQSVIDHLREQWGKYTGTIFSPQLMNPQGWRLQGVLAGQDALLPLLDYYQLSVSLQASSRKEAQLMALYVCRGFSCDTLRSYVSLDIYIAALKRHPETIQGSWLPPRDDRAELNSDLAHCAVATDSVHTIALYGGNLSCLLDEGGNTLLHTAASHGSICTLKWLLSRGMSVSCRNKKGEAPVAFARRSKHTECELLLERSWNASLRCSLDMQPTIHPSTYHTTAASSLVNPVAEARSSEPSIYLAESLAPQVPQLASDAPSSIRLGRTDMLIVFSEHSRVPSHCNVMRITESVMEGGEVGVIRVEPVDGKLTELLRRIHSDRLKPSAYLTIASFRLELCSQLLSGLQAVHRAGIVHHAIQPSNIFYCEAEAGIRLMLGVSGCAVASTLQDEGVFTSGNSRPGSAGDVFAAGCVISLVISGQHIFGIQSNDQLQNIAHGLLANAADLKRVSHEAFDLVESMVLRQPTIEQCIAHPFFWNAKARLLYISEIVRTGRHLRLPSGERLGLGSDWRKQIPGRGVLNQHMATSKASSYSDSPSDLLRMIRNFYQHCPHAGTDDGGNALLISAADELKRFPGLFVYLHSTFGDI